MLMQWMGLYSGGCSRQPSASDWPAQTQSIATKKERKEEMRWNEWLRIAAAVVAVCVTVADAAYLNGGGRGVNLRARLQSLRWKVRELQSEDWKQCIASYCVVM